MELRAFVPAVFPLSRPPRSCRASNPNRFVRFSLLSFATASTADAEACKLRLGALSNPSRSRIVSVRCSKDEPGVGMRKDPLLGNEDELEAELQQAIQSEDYTRAAIVRDRLRGLQQDCVTGVLEANARFYRAFEQGDLAAMRKIWKKGDNVHCVHPGASRISGHELVISSWEVMLGPEVDLPLRIQLEHVEVVVKGDLGFVSCLEVVRSGSSWGKQIATNAFEKKDGVWQIFMHHASHAREN